MKRRRALPGQFPKPMSKNNHKEAKEITIAEVAQEMREGFKDTAKRFEGMDRRFESIEGRFKSISGRFDDMDGRFEAVDQQFLDLAQLVEFIARNLSDFQQEVKGSVRELRGDVNELSKGMFTPDEKKSILDTVELINDRLADDVLGKGSITLTRPEYDTLTESVRLPNRFLQPATIEME